MRYHALLLALCLFVGLGQEQTSAIALQGPVNDQAGMLTSTQVKELSALLLQWEKETTNQIVVLTIPKLDGKDISQFAIATFNEWKLGQKGKDNGALLVISKADRKNWIAVGRGLEGVLTDVQCHRILQNIVQPKFRAGDFYGGIKECVVTINKVIHGEFVAEQKPLKQSFWATPLGITIIVIVVVGVVVLLVMACSAASGNGDSCFLGAAVGSIFDGGGSSGDSGGGGYSGGGGDCGGGGGGGDW